MSQRLCRSEKKLLAYLQSEFPLEKRPFARIAEALGMEEKEVLSLTARLKRKGLIRRIGPVIDQRAVGRVATLVAGYIPPGLIQTVAERINSIPGVSHNYTREPHKGECPFNMWFTLSADGEREIEDTVRSLSEEFGVKFVCLPATEVFKIEVKFEIDD